MPYSLNCDTSGCTFASEVMEYEQPMCRISIRLSETLLLPDSEMTNLEAFDSNSSSVSSSPLHTGESQRIELDVEAEVGLTEPNLLTTSDQNAEEFQIPENFNLLNYMDGLFRADKEALKLPGSITAPDPPLSEAPLVMEAPDPPLSEAPLVMEAPDPPLSEAPLVMEAPDPPLSEAPLVMEEETPPTIKNDAFMGQPPDISSFEGTEEDSCVGVMSDPLSEVNEYDSWEDCDIFALEDLCVVAARSDNEEGSQVTIGPAPSVVSGHESDVDIESNVNLEEAIQNLRFLREELEEQQSLKEKQPPGPVKKSRGRGRPKGCSNKFKEFPGSTRQVPTCLRSTRAEATKPYALPGSYSQSPSPNIETEHDYSRKPQPQKRKGQKLVADRKLALPSTEKPITSPIASPITPSTPESEDRRTIHNAMEKRRRADQKWLMSNLVAVLRAGNETPSRSMNRLGMDCMLQQATKCCKALTRNEINLEKEKEDQLFQLQQNEARLSALTARLGLPSPL